MQHNTELTWKGNMNFETELDGHKLVLDADEEAGGEDLGMRPKKLMLTSLAGCTGMDVVSILKKMRIKYEGLKILVDGTLTDEHPKHYQSMHVTYIFSGADLPIEKLQKAVDLSAERYCGVSALYKMAIPVTHEVVIQ